MKFMLLGNGMVFDETEKKLSFKKAYALLFYLVIEKTALRENMINLLWGNLSEDAAKRNLRNAVYVIRKNLGKDIVLSPKRDILKINDDEIDYCDVFSIDQMSAKEILDLRDYLFLNGFHLGDTPYFDEWLMSQRYHFIELLIRRLNILANEAIKNNEMNTAEQLCKKMILLDEFDENAYRLLFTCLEKQGKHAMITTVYNQLCDLLNKEMTLKPDDATQLAYETAMMAKSKNFNQTKKIFGRVEELNYLKASLFRSRKTGNNETVILHGSYGIGKTTVMNMFYDSVNKDYLVFEGRCYKAEMAFPLSPWLVVLEEIKDHLLKLPSEERPDNLDLIDTLLNGDQLTMNLGSEAGTINSYVMEKIIMNWMEILTKRSPVIILFEDLQWMDKMSLVILIKLMSLNLFIVGSLNTDYTSFDGLMDIIGTSARVNSMPLKPFNKIESFEFVQSLLPNKEFDLETLEEVYLKSEGNPLFLNELIPVFNSLEKNIPQKIADIMQKRFRLLSSNEQKLLKIASNFYDSFSYQVLNHISGMDEWNLLETLGSLIKKHILIEVKRNDDTFFKFSHQLFRESVYTELPITLRRVYHGKIGQELEKRYKKPNLMIVYRLLHNFSLAKESIKELKYRIQFVTDYFNVVHEMFPVNSNHVNYETDYSEIVDLDELVHQLNQIESLFEKVQTEIEFDHKYAELQFSYHKLIGRFRNIKGRYEEAYECIEKMLYIANEHLGPHEILSGYLQMIYYAFNTRNLNLLNEYLKKGFDLVEKENLPGMRAVLLRLKGYGLILSNELDEGIVTLKESLHLFKSLDNDGEYVLNIIGAYYYLGEAYRFKSDHESSIKYLDTAIGICKKYGYKNKVAFLYGAKGQIYYELGQFKEAKKHLTKANKIYAKHDALWGKVINLGYYAMVLMREKKFDEVSEILKIIENSDSTTHNDYQKAMILRIKAEICYFVTKHQLSGPLALQVNCKEEKYCVIGMQHLSHVNSTYEAELLKKMNALCGYCKTQQIS
ncbi:tetratricopeptide repeat protein [Acidaminobacter sp. JC074]|uniref:AAA family ATPase n=1 Tax=Acidaminobacter sp. JC074 TaxID=2530199 RepID=UPI001F10A8A3|nr:AAA family ATPase [Acidaminobacter sp. JC074]MCH4886133.1 tetratricopeptide repeat protein [Acidaminobacter sp. JC074]